MTTPVLLDSSALIALAIDVHEHHVQVATWLGRGAFATCPITEGALIRITARSPETSITQAVEFLTQVSRTDRHEFWPDDISYRDVKMVGVTGHKQVTDSYLAQLARNRGARLATLDKGLAALHTDVAELVPVA